jgi:hypothetical protein
MNRLLKFKSQIGNESFFEIFQKKYFCQKKIPTKSEDKSS